jgi:putative protease
MQIFCARNGFGFGAIYRLCCRQMVATAQTESVKAEPSPVQMPRRPELLAPAGDWECVKAAVENGADAVYFGLEKFNARMRALNFTEADLPKLMEFLHRRGVKGYVTFNILVFQNELADAENYLRAIIAAGVDAAIVQDVGICRMIRKLSPDFPIHASTQMTVTSAAGVEFARELGCNLVVLARECSIKEIEKIQNAQGGAGSPLPAAELQTNDGAHGVTRPTTLPLEVFVHGALCVAYSGQCLTSESLGGRSANRGECAQACRMPYDLISDGQPVPLGDKRYLLSPQDLSGLEVLPELVRAGVASLKIEGRLKSPEYVASITKVYRAALDKLFHHPDTKAQNKSSNLVSSCLGGSSSDRYELEMAFSRGLHTGWFGGTNNQQLVHARFGKKRGVFLGEVTRVQNEKVTLSLQAPLKLGDGVVFDAGRPDEKEEGGRIYGIKNSKFKINNSEVEESVLEFGYGNIDFNRVHVGDKLWKTNDPELDKRLRQSFAGDSPRFQRPIEMEVHGLVGKLLTIIARDEEGHVVQLDSTMPLARAEKQPLTTERLREQLGRLGGTPLALGGLKNNLSGEVMLPMSELNRLRREVVAELETLRAQPKRWMLTECSSRGNEAHSSIPFNQSLLTSAATNPELIVLVRSLPQLEAALKCGVRTVYCEFEDPKKYREAVTTFHTACGCSAGGADDMTRPAIWVAPPRIFKMGEDWVLNQVRSCNADGYLVRNYDHLNFFADCRKRGDYSLNVANALAADYFKNKFGLEQITPSYDLNFTQLEALLQAAPPEWFEITIHQHMPMFHMEHCVFCAFLSAGTDYTNCGRPCDTHVVKLRDRVGAEHALKADAGCRNTVFNSQTQTGAEYIAKMIELGVRNFRVEFLDETPETVERTIAKYRQLLRGEIDGTQLWRELKLFNQLGVTRGQMGK